MKIIRDWKNCPPEAKNATVAIGNFDGVHLGHRAVLEKAKQNSRRPLAVMTFEPHPRMFFASNKQVIRLESFKDKVLKLKQLGVDVIYVMRFNQQFSSLTAEEFISKVLRDALDVKAIITGDDFVFGKGRAGNSALLTECSKKLGFGYHKADAVVVDGQRCSSTVIRGMIRQARFAEAKKLLGDYYSISGRVVKGDGRGRKLGYPTANIHYSPDIIVPPYGIYACFAEVNGRRLQSVSSFGVRPTFGHNAPSLEVHIPDFSEDLYFKKIRVIFVQKIREEIKFDSINELKKHIESDIEAMKKVLLDEKTELL